MHINGYNKNTTPRLEKDNIISFSNMISEAPCTIQSTPMILSRKRVHDRYPIAEKSIISAFNEAGFKTWYVSYLTKSHIGDSEINLIANEANEYKVSSVNVNTLEELLSDTSNRKFIVYKTIGSHPLFHDRYPKNFNIFKPSFSDVKYYNPTSSKKDKELYVNSYDNSLLYSLDYQVHEFLSVLKKVSGEVIFIFCSDHGTPLLDDDKTLTYGNIRGNYSIAQFYWFNEEYRANYSYFVSELEKSKHWNLTSEYLMDTILTLSHISSSVLKGKNIIGLKESELSPRNVYFNGKIFDYDKLEH